MPDSRVPAGIRKRGSHGEFEKRLGLFPVLTLAPLPEGPQFRKRLLRSFTIPVWEIS